MGFLLIRGFILDTSDTSIPVFFDIPSTHLRRPNPQTPPQSISSAETALAPARSITDAAAAFIRLQRLTLQNNREYADRSYMDIVSVLATTVSSLITDHIDGSIKREIENLMKEPNVYNYEKMISLLSEQEHEQFVKKQVILERVSMLPTGNSVHTEKITIQKTYGYSSSG